MDRNDFPFDHISPSFISKYESCHLAALYYKEKKPKVWDSRYADQGSYTHSMIAHEYDQSQEVTSLDMDSEMMQRHTEAMRGWKNLCIDDKRFFGSG